MGTRSAFLRRLPVISVLLGSLVLAAPMLAQQNLNEQFLSAVEAGEWQRAIDLIDQIVEDNPGRQESLAPFRQKYTQRLEIDQQFTQGNWQTASTLMEQFISRYPEEASALQGYRANLRNLAELQTLVQEGNYQASLDKTKSIQQSIPELAELMEEYQTQILSTIPVAGQPLATNNFTLTVSQLRDVTRQAAPETEDDSRRLLVVMTVLNTSGDPQQLDSTRFGLLDWETGKRYGPGTGISGDLLEGSGLQSFSTEIFPGSVIQTGLIFSVPDDPESLFFTLGDSRWIRLQ